MHLVVAVNDAFAHAVPMDDTGITCRTGRTCIGGQAHRRRRAALAVSSCAAIAVAVAVPITVTAVPVTVATTVAVATAIAISTAVAIASTIPAAIAVAATIAVAVSTTVAISLSDCGGTQNQEIRGGRNSRYGGSKQSHDYRSPGNSHAVRLFFAARLTHIL